jgi:hypothetical protein
METAATIQKLINGEAIVTQKSEIDDLKKRLEGTTGILNDYRYKVSNVEGYIRDIISMEGDLSEEMKEVARMLDIDLVRHVEGTITFEVSYSLDLPLGIEVDELEFSADVSCDTYEAENFEWDENTYDHTGEVL